MDPILSKNAITRRIAANIAKLPELRKDLVDPPGSQPKLVTTAWAGGNLNGRPPQPIRSPLDPFV